MLCGRRRALTYKSAAEVSDAYRMGNLTRGAGDEDPDRQRVAAPTPVAPSGQ